MAATKFVFWNSSGIKEKSPRTDAKLTFFDKEFPNSSFDIAAFVETHHRNSNETPELINQFKSHYHLVYSPTPDGQSHAGALVLISKEFEILKTDYGIPGRLITLEVQKLSSKK